MLLAIVERVGGLVVGLAWDTPWFVRFIAALVPIALAQRVLRGYLRTRAASTALSRIVVRSLEVENTPIESTSVAIIDAAHHASRAVADIGVSFVADAVGVLAGIALLATFANGMFVVAAALFLIGIGAGARSLLLRPTSDPFQRYIAAVEHVADAFDGRGELLASGERELFVRRAHVAIDSWRRSTWLSSGNLVRAGGWPAIAGAMAAIVLWIWHGTGAFEVRQALVAAVFAPVTLALVRGAYELSKTTAQISPLCPLFEGEAPESPSGETPEASRLSWANVTVRYGTREVLSDVSLEVEKGEAVALTGANGAGKTTLLLCSLGLRALTAGTVRIGGAELGALDKDAWRQRVSYLPQRPYLLPRRTVREAMLFPARELDDRAIENLLRQVALWERLTSFSGEPLNVQTDSLSAGERQRLALARMLATNADAYLLDEPDANLDANGIELVAKLIRRFAERGKIVVYAVHSPHLTAAADRVVTLLGGKVSAVEPPAMRA